MQATAIHKKLRAAGLRHTKARETIIDSLAQAAEPVSISTLATTTRVDQATIYRNIPALLTAEVIEAIAIAPGDTRYALAHEHHDHVVCHDCGRVEHIHCTTPPPPSTTSFASIDHHAVTYYGLCNDCSS